MVLEGEESGGSVPSDLQANDETYVAGYGNDGSSNGENDVEEVEEEEDEEEEEVGDDDVDADEEVEVGEEAGVGEKSQEVEVVKVSILDDGHLLPGVTISEVQEQLLLKLADECKSKKLAAPLWIIFALHPYLPSTSAKYLCNDKFSNYSACIQYRGN